MLDDKIAEELRRKSEAYTLSETDANRVNPGYFRFLDYFGLERQSKKVAGCRTTVARVKCVGSVTHRGVYVLQCQSRACPSDDWVQVVAQLNDMRFKLYKMFTAMKESFHVWTADFTIASDLWEKGPRILPIWLWTLGLLSSSDFQRLSSSSNVVSRGLSFFCLTHSLTVVVVILRPNRWRKRVQALNVVTLLFLFRWFVRPGQM